MLREEILDILFDREITQKELTTILKSSRSRVSEVLKELEGKGLVVRKRISQRTVSVSLNHDNTLRVGILRSSEYAFVVSALHALKAEIPFKVRVYDNSLEALRDLMIGLTDVVASPLISGYFFHLIDNNLRPVAGIARGGSGMLKRKERGLIGTTPLSKMDRESREFGNYSRIYYKSIEDILRGYGKGEVDAAVVWEPFLTMNKGIRNPIGGVCCCLFSLEKNTPSVNSFLRKYLELVDLGVTENNRREISTLLSSEINVPPTDIDKSLDSYEFSAAISKRDAEDQVTSFGLPIGREVDTFLERCARVSV